MNKVLGKIVKFRKALIIVFILFLVIFSFKSILFFFNYISVKYFIKTGKTKMAANQAYKTIINLPKITINKGTKKNILKTMIQDKDLLKVFNDKNFSELSRQYRDNFYYQYIFGDLYVQKNWMHLDQLSYYFLSYPAANNWTKKIFNKIEPEFSKNFLRNLLDFLKWQNNLELFNYLSKKYQINDYNYIRPPKGIIYQISIHKMKDFISDYLKIGRDKIGENLLNCYDFENTTVFKNNWFFSDMSNREPFGEGAFFVDNEEISNNNMIRIFNVFLNNNQQLASRGGIWYKVRYKRNESIFKGYYVLSFDYWLKSGQEKPQLWVGKREGREIKKQLKEKNKVWIKVIYILNNSKGNVDLIKPLIRTFGKGSMWVDNIFFSKLECESLNFKKSYKIFYQYQ